MLNKISSLESNNNLAFKSSFKNNDLLQGFIDKANNRDLVDFYQTLELMKHDGKNEDYFIKESQYKRYNPLSGYSPYETVEEILLCKQNMEDMSVETVEAFALGGALLETASKDVISELARILRRKVELFHSVGLRNNTINGINKLLK